jgi:hypothetical protein
VATGLLLAAALPALALPDAPESAPDHNRRLLEKYRTDPDHYARLRRDLAAFQALPPERQERVRRFDRDLHDLDDAEQRRLWGVLERYVAWYDRLPEDDQKRIDAAADPTDRLHVVQEIRDRQFVERLPKAERDEWPQMNDAARAARLADLRKQERQRRQEWVAAFKPRTETPPPKGPKPPARLDAFPRDVQDFVKNQLTPMLSETEKKQLTDAEGKSPELARVVLALSRNHPVLPPLANAPPVVRFADVPEVKRPPKEGPRQKLWDEAKSNEGRWPQFALALVELLRREGRPVPPTGACRPADFSKEVPNFIKDQLTPKLTADEKRQLADAEGQWPDYPKLLHKLADAHNLVIPGLSLPGPRELWDAARAP